VFGWRVFTKSGDRCHAALSLTLGCVALAALVVSFTIGLRLPFPGLVQKVFQVATDVWVFLSALGVLRHTRPAA
jgi:hypothetical protein